jgi:hypothetical protein
MQSDDLLPLIGHKRSRPSSPTLSVTATVAPSPAGSPARVHAPKRLRKNPERETAAPREVNPLGRRKVKDDAKRLKRAERRRWRAGAGGDGMDVDANELEGTFMV